MTSPCLVPGGADITDAELQIIEFLMTSDAATPAELPDWLLMLVKEARQKEKDDAKNRN